MTYEMKLQEMFDDGMEKGMEKGTQKIVLKMLRDNTDRGMISRFTDLSLPEIEKIARENGL